MPHLGVVDKKLIATNIGAALKKLRNDKNLSMQQLATLAEIEKSQIYRIENGKVDLRISTLYLLADTLKVDVTDFFNP
ncbi:helix-turn-helix transcriptional regulator [uncultured Mucilaginibacter sp.]|uniref:helix-turn-helix domain-containing protein n=1 Tax=uncultured Mucilaginibacter sp. TaxID=797541 RepID=UPI0025F32F55|nr:helix-turn-helix transcriptional regulator [uncultured Mucilaginibacter sp.]